MSDSSKRPVSSLADMLRVLQSMDDGELSNSRTNMLADQSAANIFAAVYGDKTRKRKIVTHAS